MNNGVYFLGVCNNSIEQGFGILQKLTDQVKPTATSKLFKNTFGEMLFMTFIRMIYKKPTGKTMKFLLDVKLHREVGNLQKDLTKLIMSVSYWSVKFKKRSNSSFLEM